MSDVNIADNYRRLRESIPDEVTIVGATKTRSAGEIREAIDAGLEVVGENYVQEAQNKYAELSDAADGAEWHMIGHLQRNKINKALPLFDLIQTVDSHRLSKRADSPVPVFIQVNIAGEESKYGIPVDEVFALAEEACELPGLHLKGLMTMEPYFEDPERARPYFRRMRQIFEDMRDDKRLATHLDTLSMGMTNSYRGAIDEGATMVRVGTAIFGPRERR
mgnify:CR=1 FL=1